MGFKGPFPTAKRSGNGSTGGIRTHIFHVLSVLPLPIGLRCYMVELDGVGPIDSALSERCFAVELQLVIDALAGGVRFELTGDVLRRRFSRPLP